MLLQSACRERNRSVRTTLRQFLVIAALFYCAVSLTSAANAADPLPSVNEGKSKQSIVDFVTKVTTEGSPDFIPIPQRIATFDNDGTLWCEKPLPVQLYFALD